MHAGLSGDRAAFPSKVRFTKRKKNRLQLIALISPLVMFNDASQVEINKLPLLVSPTPAPFVPLKKNYSKYGQRNIQIKESKAHIL